MKSKTNIRLSNGFEDKKDRPNRKSLELGISPTKLVTKQELSVDSREIKNVQIASSYHSKSLRGNDTEELNSIDKASSVRKSIKKSFHNLVSSKHDS